MRAHFGARIGGRRIAAASSCSGMKIWIGHVASRSSFKGCWKIFTGWEFTGMKVLIAEGRSGRTSKASGDRCIKPLSRNSRTSGAFILARVRGKTFCGRCKHRMQGKTSLFTLALAETEVSTTDRLWGSTGASEFQMVKRSRSRTVSLVDANT
jgi:hypothetical protein